MIEQDIYYISIVSTILEAFELQALLEAAGTITKSNTIWLRFEKKKKTSG